MQKPIDGSVSELSSVTSFASLVHHESIARYAKPASVGDALARSTLARSTAPTLKSALMVAKIRRRAPVPNAPSSAADARDTPPSLAAFSEPGATDAASAEPQNTINSPPADEHSAAAPNAGDTPLSTSVITPPPGSNQQEALAVPGNREGAVVRLSVSHELEHDGTEAFRQQMTLVVSDETRSVSNFLGNESALADAAAYTRAAKRKISRVYGKAEDLCQRLFDAHVQSQTDVLGKMRLAADEIAFACIKHGLASALTSESTTFHQRFLNLQEEYDDLLHYDLSGHHERANLIRTNSEALEGEMYRRVVEVVVALQAKGPTGLPKRVCQVTPRTFADEAFGIVIHPFEHHHDAAKHFVKSLSRFANLAYNSFSLPLMMAVEVCGLSYVAATMPPLSTVIRDPLAYPEVKHAIDAAVSELQVDYDDSKATNETLFAFGSDGRTYALYAYGLIPSQYSTNFLNLLDPGTGFDPVTLDGFLMSRMDHAAVEAVAMAKSGGGHVSKALHRNGLKVSHVGTLHSYLSRQEVIRAGTIGAVRDANLFGALVSCIADMFARTLKCILRRLWADNIACNAEIPVLDRPKEMAVLAHQLVNLLVVENHASRSAPELQLYKKIIKLAKQLYPVEKKKKEEPVWDEDFISETHIAVRVAHMTGLRFVDNTLCGVNPGRMVRSTRLFPREMWWEVHRGRHQEVMKRLVTQIKTTRASNPIRAFHLTCHLADIFHQAQGRAGITRRPGDLFDKAAWLRSRDRQAELNNSGGKDTDDDPLIVRRELCVLHMQAMQSIANCDREINEAEASQRDKMAAQQAASMITGAVSLAASPKTNSMTPLDLAIPNVSSTSNLMGNSRRATPLGSARGGSDDGTIARGSSRRTGKAIPPAAQMTHSEAVTALSSYVRRSMEAFKDTAKDESGALKFTVEDMATRRQQYRALSENLRRVSVLKHAAQVIREKSLSDSIEVTLKSLERFRRAGILDARAGISTWNDLFDAEVQARMRFDGDSAIQAARRKLSHAEKIFGAASLQVAACHSDIGSVFLNLGRGPEGRQELELGFRHLTQVAPLCTATFTSANNLGYTYFRLAERSLDPTQRKRRHGFLRMTLPPLVTQLLDEAENAFTFVINNRLYANTITVADALNNLGSVNTFRGSYRAAMPQFEGSLALTRGLYSDEHPDRASAIRNLRTCERRMKSNAALWITCFFKRFQARKHLKLLQKGALHVERFQRLGRGFADRLRLYQLAEYRKIRQIGRGLYDDGGSRYMGADEDEDVMEDFRPAAGARVDASSPTMPAAGSADLPLLPSVAGGHTPMVTPQAAAINMRAEVMPGTVDEPSPQRTHTGTFSSFNSRAQMSLAAEPSVVISTAQLDALLVLQGIGRACLTRGMIRKIYIFKQKKKKKAKA
jgi:hypothetical protein